MIAKNEKTEKLEIVIPAGTGGDGDYTLSITPERAGWAHSSLNVLELGADGTHTFDTGESEWVVLPLSGSCTVECDGESFTLAGRRGVFTRVTDFAYVPRDATTTVTSAAGGRFALCGARAQRRLTARYGPAEGVQVELRGAGQASRQVNNFCTPESFEADRLIACEVLTPGGNWSSYPPHKHDEQGGRFALCGARANWRLTARYGPAEAVQVELRGAGQASRQVNNFCTPATFEADKMIAVEVITPGGNWSSFPPHKHDEAGPDESCLEEVYYFEADSSYPPARPAPAATSGCTARVRARRSTCAPRCAPATRSSSPTAGTARRWPPPATTSTTSTSWRARIPSGSGRSATTRPTPGSALCGTARRSTPACR